jgi:DNA-binding NtrC family response regulator
LGFHLRQGAFVLGFGGLPAEVENEGRRLVQLQPKMDGIELIDEVRKIDKSIPILIITAYGSIESAEEAIHKGAYDYIAKPFRKEQILIAINRALEWKEMKREINSFKQGT